jgi:hypothetical protein
VPPVAHAATVPGIDSPRRPHPRADILDEKLPQCCLPSCYEGHYRCRPSPATLQAGCCRQALHPSAEKPHEPSNATNDRIPGLALPTTISKPPLLTHACAGEARSSSPPTIKTSPHWRDLWPISPVPLAAVTENRQQTPPASPGSKAPLLLGSGLPAQLHWARPIVAHRE